MGVYQIETDQGTYEVTTDEPDQTHPQLPDVGKSLDLSPAESVAQKAVSAVSPTTTVPTDTSPGGYFSRALGATKDAILSPIAPFIPSLRGRLFNPNAGEAGPSQMLEQEGQRLGQAVRASGQNIGEQIATSKFGQQNPNTAAAIGAGIGTVADVTSNLLTPSNFQQAIGMEGLTSIAPAAAKALANPIDSEAGDMARRAVGQQKSQMYNAKSPFEGMRRQAQVNRAARDMLDKGDIPFFGSSNKMQENALRSLNTGARQVSDILSQADSSLPPMEESSLDSTLTKALNPKNQAELNTALAVRQDLSDRLVNGRLSTKELDDLRSSWGQSGFRDKTVGSAAADTYKKAWKWASDEIKSQVGGLGEDQLAAYKTGMAQQETAITNLKGIVNKLAREQGNNLVSLPAFILAAGRVGSGDILGAGEVLGISEIAKRSGAAMAANTLKGTADVLKNGFEASPGLPGAVAGVIHNYISQNAPEGSKAPSQFMEIIKRASNKLASGDTGGVAEASPQPQNDMMSLSPLSPEKLAVRSGIEKFLSDDLEGAKQAWQRALKLNPKNLEARRGLERLASKQGKDIDAYKPKR